MRCPNCGGEYEGERCPNCGQPKSKSGSRVAAIVILIFLVIPAALFGACSAFGSFSVLTGSGSDKSLAGLFLTLTAVGVLAFGGFLTLVVKLWRK